MTDLTLGKDYQEYSIQNQMELLFSIKTGAFPLYVPGYAHGHSSSTLTLGQVFHPLPHIASIFPGYWEGKALQWNTLLRFLSLGLTHLALFTFLRKINLNTLFSFLLSLITVYNLRMLDLFRFGASLETYTGFLLLCTAIGWYFIQPTKSLGPLSIAGATYWLICSGHPTMMFYGMLGAVIFLLVAPFFLSTMLQNRQINYSNALMFYIKSGFFITLGALLSSAYIVPFYFDFMSMNSLRVATKYDPQTIETFFGTISNFFMPFFSDVHSAFGGSSLFLMAAVLPILRCFRVKIPVAIWIIWGFVLFTFLYMQESRTPLHEWAWDYLPFVSSLRVAGRISLITPVFIMLLLAWIINAKSISFHLRGITVTLSPYMLLGLISLLLILLYSLLSVLMQTGLIETMDLGVFPPKYINNIPLWVISFVMLSGALSLLVLSSYSAYPRLRNVLGVILCLITVMQIAGILRYGTFVANKHEQPSFQQMLSQKILKLDYLYNPGSGMYSSVILNQLTKSFLEPFLGKIYSEVIPVTSQDEAYDQMEDKRLPHQVFVEKFSPEQAKTINDNANDLKEGMVTLVYSSFNRLQFHVYSETTAIFELSYPYTGHWKAFVDGNKTTVYRANGAAHAVEIPGGESLVEFRYWSPAAFWGIIISFLTFTLIGLYVCFRAFNGLPRIIAVVLVIIVGIGGAVTWHHSLYAGSNLNTQYTWSFTPRKPKSNLAYGKSLSRSHVPVNIWYQKSIFFGNHMSKVTDGNKSPGSGFIYKLENNFAVIIDLDRREEINSVILHESIKELPANSRHLTLSVSLNEKQWDIVASVTSQVNAQEPLYIEFDSPKSSRYIKIKATGTGRLSLDEVEVYGK